MSLFTSAAEAESFQRLNIIEFTLRNLDQQVNFIEGQLIGDVDKSVNEILNDHDALLTAHTNQLTNHQNRLDGHDTTLIGYGTRITTAEGNIVSLDSRLTTAESTITSNNSALDTRVTTAEGEIDTLQTDTTSLDGRVTTAEGEIDTLQTETTSLDGRVTTNEGTISTNGGNISSIDTRLTTAEGSVTDHETRITTIETTLEEGGNAENATFQPGDVNSAGEFLLHLDAGLLTYEYVPTLSYDGANIKVEAPTGLFIKNTTATPSTIDTSTTGGVLFVHNGELKFKGPGSNGINGTITTLAVS